MRLQRQGAKREPAPIPRGQSGVRVLNGAVKKESTAFR